jgi:hypothetical protein
MKRLIIIMVAVALIMSAAYPLLAKGKSRSGNAGYYVSTGNGGTQMLGGKSGGRSSGRSKGKGLERAAERSKAVNPPSSKPIKTK